MWRLLLLLSAGLYVLAVLSPAIVPDSPAQNGEVSGFECLLFGPLSWTVNPIMAVAWSANFIYLALIVFTLSPLGQSIPTAAGLLPFLVGLTCLGIKKSVADLEGGSMADVHLASGAWLWLASLALMLPTVYLKRTRR